MDKLCKICDICKPKPVKEMIKGSVLLQKKNVLDFNDFDASVLDNLHELLGKRVSLQLISADDGDPGNGMKGTMGKPAYLEWATTPDGIAVGQTMLTVNFEWDKEQGIPEAFIIKNGHHSEFYLKTLTLDNVPRKGRVHFVCNSWIYPSKYYKYNRIFFSNQSYLPGDTPEALHKYREEELVNLRGNGNGKLEEWDRVYDYAFYNDLGNPDKSKDMARPVLGGSKEYPYPRRGRTGRPPTKKDPRSESRLPLIKSLNIYVPRDERFGHLKMSDFLAYALRSISQTLLLELKAAFDKTPNEFDNFEDVLDLYEEKIKLPSSHGVKKVKHSIPFELINELVRRDNGSLYKFPMPQVIQADETAWRTDEEFAREMLAGLNPVIIRLLTEFPPTSKLDPKKYGDQRSSITEEHILKNLNGLTIYEALKNNDLFILDHHDTLMPYLNRINNDTNSKIYASRTILLLKDGVLNPLAIELSLPSPEGEEKGVVSKVFTPSNEGIEGSIWQLAKAYVVVNDSGVHQLISHWLNTHCVMEPFVIATNRQLSVLHPIHKLLSPHFRDTMNINAFARQILINGSGLFEFTVFPGKFALELSSMVYKDWKFTEQGLPADLLKRGMAVHDPKHPHKLRLLIEDYPYAVDGLEIWSAIETWVTDYCSIYYASDYTLQTDRELQEWWKEIREVGHGDKKDEPWWPTMQTVAELTSTLTTIIWIASALHAAINFGQYPYAGYLPNRPTISRRFMPEPGSKEFEELKDNPDSVFLKTITSQLQTVIGIALIEILSRHSTDEVYLGQAVTPEWTADSSALKAFQGFGERLMDIEKRIEERNKDEKLKNRVGPVQVPYTLLYPNTSDDSMVGGLTGKGIPNSVSI